MLNRKKRFVIYRGWVRRLSNINKMNRIFRILNNTPVTTDFSNVDWDMVNKQLSDNQKEYEEKVKRYTPTFEDLHRPFTI